MSQEFNQVRVGNSSRSTFNLSHHQVTSSDFGYLIPICVRDLVPNDDVVCTPYIFARLAPLALPVYGRIKCRVHSFFVPYRILFPDWSEFITQSAASSASPPYLTVGKMRELLSDDPQYIEYDPSNSVARSTYCRLMSNIGLNPDLLACPTLSDNERISAFRFLAYYRIWLDWFMDSNINDHSQLVAAFNDALVDGGNMSGIASTILKYRCACFGKDYFTTAKLHPQASEYPASVNPELSSRLWQGVTSASDYNLKIAVSNGVPVLRTNLTNVQSDEAITFSVEDLRAAVSLQRYLERNNYVGTKVINQLLAHFGVAPSPERLDMSEFIGGSSFPVQIGDITSTAPSSDPGEVSTIGLGAQAGKGVAASRTKTVRYHAKEHGVFMTLLSILPDTGYYQGIPKVMQLGCYGDALDFYTPEFENLGFQEILNKEVYLPSGSGYDSYDPDGIFGYAPRYAFLKWQQDILGSDFVGSLGSDSPIGNVMDAWHLFRKFNYDDDDPLALNDNFVECNNHNTDYDRIFQVTSNTLDHFYFNIDVDFKSTRNMVGFAEPSLDSVNMEDGNKITLPYGGTRL